MSGGFSVLGEICNGTDQGTATATSNSVSVSSSSTGGTYGSYTQIVASSAIDACFVQINLCGGNFTTSNNLMVKLAVGAGGSEIDIIKDLIFFDGASAQQAVTYAFPVVIPAATRISAAIAPQAGGVDSLQVQVTLYDGSFVQTECAGVDSIGLASTHGTTVTAGAANTKGSYAQLSASTARDYLGICFAIDGNGGATIPTTTALIDIAIGAGGSERIIIPNYMIWNASGSNPSPSSISRLYPIPVAAGTRVAARFQNSGGSGSFGLTLYGVYQ